MFYVWFLWVNKMFCTSSWCPKLIRNFWGSIGGVWQILFTQTWYGPSSPYHFFVNKKNVNIWFTIERKKCFYNKFCGKSDKIMIVRKARHGVILRPWTQSTTGKQKNVITTNCQNLGMQNDILLTKRFENFKFGLRPMT